MAIMFDHDDAAYLAWCAEHPTGYVVNLGRRPESEPVILHRARCPSLRLRPAVAVGEPSDQATARRRKLCANTVANLRAHLRTHVQGVDDITRRCGVCKP